jgi:catechol 2,3-dioxygenase
VGGNFVFLSFGERHHDLALQAVGPSAPGAQPYGVGLYHFALEVPSLDALAEAYMILREAGVPVSPVDHGVSKAFYFADPDGNGLEVYVDTRHNHASWQGMSRPLDVEALLADRQEGEVA